MRSAAALRSIPTASPAKKTPNPTDKHVGSRVRLRRMMLEVSQTQLGDEVGVTFQQIQKYEKGVNRIGASRLQQIADALQTPVPFFFEGAPALVGGKRVLVIGDPGAELLATRDGLALAQAFNAISDDKHRALVVKLAEIFASPTKDGR
jgi:transcriptional regulator with XRE-family HTH domain